MKKYFAGLVMLFSLVVVPAFASAQTSATITSFGAKDPNPTNRSVTVIWNASSVTDAQLDVVCNPGSISFTTDKGNAPSCEKGGVWSWYGQNSASIIMYPVGNSQPVTVDFILTLTNNGSPTNQTQRISVTFPATPVQSPSPTITLFAAKDPNPTNRSVTMVWQASATTDAMLEVDCTPGTISFTTDKGNSPSCEKGGVWTWYGQTSASIVVTPVGNANSVTVPFTLTLTKNGSPTNQTQKIYVTFPATPTQPPAPTITLFAAKDPNPTTRSVMIAWQASAITDAQLDMQCTPGTISFITDKGNYPSCEKGGVWSWASQTNGSIAVTPLNNTQAITVPFTLTLSKNGVPTNQTQTVYITFPAPDVSSNPTINLFGAKDPNPSTKAINVIWQASGAADVSLDVVCTSGTIKFTTDKGNAPSCEKGGVWYWQNQSSGNVMMYPSGNNQPVTVDLILRLSKNGIQTDSKTMSVTFPPITNNSVPTVTNQTLPADIDTENPQGSCLNLQNNLRYRSRDISTNDEVSALQDFLQANSYLNSEPTGFFGVLTLQATKNFQQANGISPTGFVGPITRAKIKALSCQ